ncbi:MAG: hypothetical protein HRU43_02890 [Simkaniaceae bacterium]|nr:hypothetical protein [Simkaniaceae bacterium]
MIAEQFKEGYLAIGLGLNNAMITGLSAKNAPIIRFVIDSLKVENHATLANYHNAFYSLIAVAIGGLIISIFFFKETFCKSQVDFTYLNTHSKRIV